MVTGRDGNKQPIIIPIIDSSIESVLPTVTNSPVQEMRPKKNGSLCILFRKVFVSIRQNNKKRFF